MQRLASFQPLLGEDGKPLALEAGKSVEQTAHHIINYLGKSISSAVFELRTIPVQPSDNYFVSSVVLGKNVALPLEAVLRLACLSGPCVLPRVESYRDHACFVQPTSELCKRAQHSADSFSSLCSVHFSLLNLGTATSATLEATIALPMGTSLASLHLDPNTTVAFEDFGANYELNIRKYRFGASALPANGSARFTALVGCSAVDGSAVSVSMTGIDSVPRKLYFASGRPA
jgi:hypothetical protein